ncbi:DNA-formamidopyrimidine glycosylase, partial [Selenomonadales bacterium OttesenSCG-928-I06]|nr:DNA-formamidopyrimidine glycosylase [Selenomonadales bacterium OttesenSCG-928-I06]
SMPELPEVETIARTLSDKITNRKIVNIDVKLPRLIKWPSFYEFKALLYNKTILNLTRRGKYLLFHLDNDLVMVVHLRMTGQFSYSTSKPPQEKHDHIIITFDDNSTLVYSDKRTFGTFYVLPHEELWRIASLHSLGKEPLSEEFTFEYFKDNIQDKKGLIKPILLNQTIIAGLGNIYVDESLALAKIDPERICNSLNNKELKNLYNAINTSIAKGIENRGTTFSDYRDGEGNKGDNQNSLHVYGRANQPCYNCKTLIQKKKVAGRSSHYCPNCQK